jgi:hypothetical protein
LNLQKILWKLVPATTAAPPWMTGSLVMCGKRSVRVTMGLQTATYLAALSLGVVAIEAWPSAA